MFKLIDRMFDSLEKFFNKHEKKVKAIKNGIANVGEGLFVLTLALTIFYTLYVLFVNFIHNSI